MIRSIMAGVGHSSHLNPQTVVFNLYVSDCNVLSVVIMIHRGLFRRV